MPSMLIRLDESTQRALNRVAKKGARAEFVRSAIARAIIEEEEARTRRAYELQPDSESEADNWSNCEEYKR
jgi:predicted transcriptional regulator